MDDDIFHFSSILKKKNLKNSSVFEDYVAIPLRPIHLN